jgi:hypothetical protein
VCARTRYDDGTHMRYKRERPKVVQDPVTLDIIAVATGVGVEILDAFAAGDDAACSLVMATPDAPQSRRRTSSASKTGA